MTDQDAPLKGRSGVYHQGFHGGWEVEMWWSPHSRGGPTEIRVRAIDEEQVARGITTGALRAIPLAEISAEIRDDLEALSRKTAPSALSADRIDTSTRLILRSVKADPKPGRKGRPEAFHAAVALLYSWHVTRRDTNPIQSLADACGVDRGAASSWVRQARAHGMLTAVAERQAGGDLTPKATEIINEQEN